MRFNRIDSSHVVKKAITRVHTAKDNGKTFTDNLGRAYIYTTNGLIY